VSVSFLAWLMPNIEVHIGGPAWAVAGVVVALFAALVALFREEFWHRRHAPRLEVALGRLGGDFFALALRLRNASTRLAAEGVTVRVIELEPHPLEGAVGPKWVSPIVDLDQLLCRASGETTFGLAPCGEARLPLLTLQDGWTPRDPAVAILP
jgi:hypothetical protein